MNPLIEWLIVTTLLAWAGYIIWIKLIRAAKVKRTQSCQNGCHTCTGCSEK